MSCVAARPVECLDPLIAGETGQWTTKVVDQDGAPVDVTGASFSWVLTQDGVEHVRLNASPGIQLTNPAAGVILVRLAAEGSAALSPGWYNGFFTAIDVFGNKHVTPFTLQILPPPPATS